MLRIWYGMLCLFWLNVTQLACTREVERQCDVSAQRRGCTDARTVPDCAGVIDLLRLEGEFSGVIVCSEVCMVA